MKNFTCKLLCFALLITVPFCAVADDFAIIKDRVYKELMKSPPSDEEVDEILVLLLDNGSFKDIIYDDLSRVAGFPHGRHTYNLVKMAKAYNHPTSKYYQSQSLYSSIVKSFENWVDNDYVGENWHNNQITTPTNLGNLMLLVGDKLPKDLVDRAQPMIGRAHMNASGARPSGDRIVIAGILAKNLLFTGNKEAFDEIIELIEGELKFSTGKRGMQHDYSFHHRVDRVNNTDSYGYGKYANAFGEWSYYVAGTKYAFSERGINHLVDYYLDGIYKQLVYGVYKDVSVANRSITHKATFVPRPTLEIERLLLSTDYRKDELEEIIQLRKGEIKPTASFAKFFWQTEHFVVQRPHYYTSVRMYSTRNRNMEVPYNGPGKPTHHRADGTNYIQQKGDEYLNIWPVYNWQQISGTTIVQKPELYGPKEIQKDGLTEFVGAVTDGQKGAVTFDFKSPHDKLKAKKSWFFFTDEYLCLGAGINASPSLPVITTLDQALLRSDVIVNDSKGERKLGNASHDLKSVRWVLHNEVGFIFPEATDVQLSNKTEEGRWSDITDQIYASKELVKKDVFNLGIHHGERPRDASYAYIVVPGISEDEFKNTSPSNRGLRILKNTEDLQAIKSDKENTIQAVFYASGILDLADGSNIQMDSPGIIMVKLSNKGIETITVADPTRKLSRMSLTINGKYECSNESVKAIYDNKENTTILLIDLPKSVYAGKSLGFDIKKS